MERLISDGLSLCLKTAIGHCGAVLSKAQKKSDFAPGEHSTAFMTETCTDACKQCTAILSTVAASIKSSLNGKNEVGLYCISANLPSFTTRIVTSRAVICCSYTF
jgi:hypothetical protein